MDEAAFQGPAGRFHDAASENSRRHHVQDFVARARSRTRESRGRATPPAGDHTTGTRESESFDQSGRRSTYDNVNQRRHGGPVYVRV